MPTKLTLIAAILVLFTAYAALPLGLTEPMLTIEGDIEKSELVAVGRGILVENRDDAPIMARFGKMLIDRIEVDGTVRAFAGENSILGAARELFTSGNQLVAVLIVFFSVGVPSVKLLLLLTASLPPAARWRGVLIKTADVSSKWSMADVFVIAIFLAWLGGNGLGGDNSLVAFKATLGNGFWFFLGYCLLSILGSLLLGRTVSNA
ncbi:MAG: paraquat-inducible membrane protein A [Gammaproteobacteria bacterium]|nr:MAG: paraquat-inducible membrane protein A [Gammaproteobacteria bacterium]PIE37548.1 MAG: paraquat-inducible membrane protein A [Gammaproteobacteria bacterium]